MRAFMRIAAVTAAAGLFLAPAVSAASASAAAPHSAPHAVHLRGGTTKVVTAPGIAKALLSGGIIPLATGPGTEALTNAGNVRFAFPVTGGSVSLTPPSGHINHAGGILFLKGSHSAKVSKFSINLGSGKLTALVAVNGKTVGRVAIFTLNLAHAAIHHGSGSVTVSNIGVSLTKAAAGALDASLGTKLFTPGLKVGTARTTLHI
jgi:Htaa